LTAPSGCPVAHDFDPFEPSYLADPYPTLERLREAGPVHYAPSLEMWVVTRHSDIEAILKDPARFSARIAQEPVSPLTDEALVVMAQPDGPRPVMSNLDPPEHTRLRHHNMQTFSARRIAVLAPKIRARVARLVAALPVDQPVDLVPALTFPLPALTIFSLLGFPDDDAQQLKAWSDDRLYLVWGRLPADRQKAVAQNFRAFFAYCERHVARRRAEPADDFTSDLLKLHHEDPGGISPHEIASVIFGLGFAGHETTTNLLSNAVRNLVGRPDIWARLCEDASLVDRAVEEVLRLDSSVICWRRITTEPVEIGGVAIPEGAKLLLLLAAANRDPAIFEAPNDLRLDRSNGTRHLSFGKGIHFCLGAPLARLQVSAVIAELTRARPNIRLVADQPLEFPENISFRGPKRLLVTCPA
jgi:cytochrome P450